MQELANRANRDEQESDKNKDSLEPDGVQDVPGSSTHDIFCREPSLL